MSTRVASRKAGGKKTTRVGTKKSARKEAGRPAVETGPKHGATGLKVRMYRVGFGDFFLITVPTSRGDRYILIDCGVFKGTTGKGDIGSIEEAVEDLFETTGGDLALVIMTHRHADHIAGFTRAAERFKDFKASMVWMPYWEQFNDETKDSAHNLQHDIHELAMNLAMQFGGRTDRDAQLALDQLSNATGVDFNAAAKGAKKGGSNAKALDLLKNHLGDNGKNVKYYAAGDKAELPPELEGLSAEILGPPPKEAQIFMKLTDLKKGVGQYLDATTEGDDGTVTMKPFQAPWLASPRDYPRVDQRNRRIEYEKVSNLVDNSQPDMLAAAAQKIDTFLNNQSLVVLFKFAGKKLLFVGDAQAGNWEHWLYKIDAPLQDPTKAGSFTAESHEILKTIDFYKVGHHGSTNATPVPVVEALAKELAAKGFVAMCSTEPDTYGNPDKGTEVPRDPLMKALAAECALVRSDSFAVKVGTESIPASSTARLPKPKSGTLIKKGLYVEYSF